MINHPWVSFLVYQRLYSNIQLNYIPNRLMSVHMFSTCFENFHAWKFWRVVFSHRYFRPRISWSSFRHHQAQSSKCSVDLNQNPHWAVAPQTLAWNGEAHLLWKSWAFWNLIDWSWIIEYVRVSKDNWIIEEKWVEMGPHHISGPHTQGCFADLLVAQEGRSWEHT